MTLQTFVAPTVLLLLLLAGCAHAPSGKEADPRYLMTQACGPESPGAKVQAVKGSAWLKAKSREASGQFPASIRAMVPANLKMEVTNLLGGTEAVISVSGGQYTIQIPEKSGKAKVEKGNSSWGGIPLHWATDLFLGKAPCPPMGAIPDSNTTVNAEGDLVLDTPRSLGRDPEKFVYHFRRWGGRLWPESLHWESLGSVPLVVDFKFEDPDDKTGSPKKWEAKSKLGEVAVRWRDREVATPNPTDIVN